MPVDGAFYIYLSNMIYQERIDFNAMREQLEDSLEIYDGSYFQSIDRRILPKDMSKERFSLMTQGRDYKTPSNPKSDELINTADNINPSNAERFANAAPEEPSSESCLAKRTKPNV